MIRPIKKYTIKEWNKLSSIQEVLCKKFEIILTDHKTKRQKIFSILNTIKEWNKLSSIQEVLCKKFEIILTDHKTKRQKIFSILDTINFKNINKGIEIFNESIQNLGNSMDQLTREINQTSQNNIKIWSDEENNSQDKENLDKIWGGKNEV